MLFGGNRGLLTVRRVGELDGAVFIGVAVGGVPVGVVLDGRGDAAGGVKESAIFFARGINRFEGFSRVIVLGRSNEDRVAARGNGAAPCQDNIGVGAVVGSYLLTTDLVHVMRGVADAGSWLRARGGRQLAGARRIVMTTTQSRFDHVASIVEVGFGLFEDRVTGDVGGGGVIRAGS